jgi:NAD(P)-dependent dehydrogenase (short-subunit alcohol dehydrogenase family)
MVAIDPDSTVVLTGATTGIWRATAVVLAGQVGRLVVHGTEPERDVADLLATLRAAMRPGAGLVYLTADYTDLAQVRRLAADVHSSTSSIDILINNAARPGPPTYTASGGGIEITYQTNYLAPVLLTTNLVDVMGSGRPGRIINVASASLRRTRSRAAQPTGIGCRDAESPA